jgi:hypothetical protein
MICFLHRRIEIQFYVSEHVTIIVIYQPCVKAHDREHAFQSHSHVSVADDIDEVEKIELVLEAFDSRPRDYGADAKASPPQFRPVIVF